jgi:hypothetical protein
MCVRACYADNTLWVANENQDEILHLSLPSCTNSPMFCAESRVIVLRVVQAHCWLRMRSLTPTTSFCPAATCSLRKPAARSGSFLCVLVLSCDSEGVLRVFLLVAERWTLARTARPLALVFVLVSLRWHDRGGFLLLAQATTRL